MTQGGPPVGMDVSKARLDVAVTDGKNFSVGNDRAGWTELIGRLKVIGPKRWGWSLRAAMSGM